MSDPALPTPVSPRWLHALAVCTVVVTFPLLILGAEVTTKGVGMVDPQGLRTPWHIFTVSLKERGLGFLVEHSHRTVGWVVGVFILALAVSTWCVEPRRWVRILAGLCLLAVCVQGMLGALRVQLQTWLGPNIGEPLALIHGCFAQLVVALLVAVALFTSRSWARPATLAAQPSELNALYRGAICLVGLIYVQIVLGAITRHTNYWFGPRLHLLTAFLVTAVLVGFSVRLAMLKGAGGPLRNVVRWLWGILALQLFLGVEAWLTKFQSGTALWSQLQPLLQPSTIAPKTDSLFELFYRGVVRHPDFIRSIHLPVGALLFSLSVAVLLYLWRNVQVEQSLRPQLTPHQEAAA